MNRIAHITDIHLEEEFSTENGVDPKKNWEKILSDLKEKNIRSIVFGGDIEIYYRFLNLKSNGVI